MQWRPISAAPPPSRPGRWQSVRQFSFTIIRCGPIRTALYAAYCAGVAFTKSYVGYVHAVAHSLGGQYRIPHGLANAVILPYFLKAYGAACHRPLARLARLTHLATEQDTEADAAGKFIAWVEQMNEAMGIPKTIDKIEPKDIPVMARYADQEGNPLYPVPKLMDRQELAQMYEHIRTKEEPV